MIGILAFTFCLILFSLGPLHSSEDYEYEMKWNRRNRKPPTIGPAQQVATAAQEMGGASAIPDQSPPPRLVPATPLTTQMAPMARVYYMSTPMAPSSSFSTMLQDPASLSPYLNRAEKSILLQRAFYRQMKSASFEDRIVLQAELREKMRQITQDRN